MQDAYSRISRIWLGLLPSPSRNDHSGILLILPLPTPSATMYLFLLPPIDADLHTPLLPNLICCVQEKQNSPECQGGGCFCINISNRRVGSHVEDSGNGCDEMLAPPHTHQKNRPASLPYNKGKGQMNSTSLLDKTLKYICCCGWPCGLCWVALMSLSSKRLYGQWKDQALPSVIIRSKEQFQ